jgi:copper chaperone
MTRLSVPDMSCGHCKASVEAALAQLPDAGRVEVDLTQREVSVSGDASPAVLIKALDQIGFPASQIVSN